MANVDRCEPHVVLTTDVSGSWGCGAFTSSAKEGQAARSHNIMMSGSLACRSQTDLILLRILGVMGRCSQPQSWSGVWSISQLKSYCQLSWE